MQNFLRSGWGAALLCLLLPSLAWSEAADGLNVFSDGEVIYAEQINENFRYVLENGGCSVTQIESRAVIKCGDGSEAVIAGGGQVIAYPAGSLSPDNFTSIGTGDVVAKDADGVVLGKILTASPDVYTISVAIDESGARTMELGLLNDNDVGQVTTSAGGTSYYSQSNCQGQILPASPVRLMTVVGGGLAAVPDPEPVFTVAKSLSSSLYNNGECQEGETIRYFYLAYPFNLPNEILNAAYPVSAHQE